MHHLYYWMLMGVLTYQWIHFTHSLQVATAYKQVQIVFQVKQSSFLASKTVVQQHHHVVIAQSCIFWWISFFNTQCLELQPPLPECHFCRNPMHIVCRNPMHIVCRNPMHSTVGSIAFACLPTKHDLSVGICMSNSYMQKSNTTIGHDQFQG